MIILNYLMTLIQCHIFKNLSSMSLLQITATKTGLDTAKTTFKKVVHKTVETTGELIGNKITEEIVRPKPVSDANSRNVEEIVIPPEKR